MNGQYCREKTGEIDKKRRWLWLKESNLRVETKNLTFTVLELALKINCMKFKTDKIDKIAESSLCRVYGEKGESMGYVISGCKKLAHREYKRRRDNEVYMLNV